MYEKPVPAARQCTSVAVVICAYADDRRDDLIASVDSVLAQRCPVQEIVVVIDGNPGLYEWASRRWEPTGAGGPQVTVTENRRSRGLCGARNTGADTTGCDVVAFLDDDAFADRDWAERLVAAYEDGDVVATGGAALPVFEVGAPGWWPAEFHWVVGCSYRGLPGRAADVRNVIGCNMSVRKAAWRTVGGFSEEIGRVGAARPGAEDDETDLCIRLRLERPDGRIVYDPTAVVHHRVPARRLSWDYFWRRCWSEGLGKAVLAGRVGGARALASERSYVRATLPRGVLRGLGHALGGDGDGLRVAGAIAAGFCVTAGGYVTGRARVRSFGSKRSLSPSAAVPPARS
ncbi:MAG: glycosyltransferase family 2 protein [Candidatus Dormibacteraeota bacterium]|nr:glycosyltransferase family 2 protein [Candidatus Dormibacteraeota bacterium]MBO0760901.1 glycosyltransferase family 2 protein [Candidatus Dormibacteraeota bacterium]